MIFRHTVYKRALIELERAGVPDRVLETMVGKK